MSRIFFLLTWLYASFSVADSIVIQSTTSTRDSGFYNYLLPKYPNYDSVTIKVIAVGSGQAVLNAKNCDGGILIVHDTKKEQEFMNLGLGSKRHDLMYNDYIIIGPRNDPAKISSSKSAYEAFSRISKMKYKFISRSDSSGTHTAEKNIWKNTDQYNDESFDISWYYETGQGMGPTLNIAIAMNAYTLVDRSTWLKFRNKQNHVILYQNSDELQNTYGMILVDLDRCSNINRSATENLYEWLSGDDAKLLIDNYTIDGQNVFFTY